MRLLIPGFQSADMLSALVLAQDAPAGTIILADPAMQALALQSAVHLQVFPFDGLPQPDAGDRLTGMVAAAAYRLKWRKELDALSTLGITALTAVAGQLSFARRLADWLDVAPGQIGILGESAPAGDGLTGDDSTKGTADGVTVAQPESPATQTRRIPALYAHADALARVAAQFRQVPSCKQGAYRFLWVLPHASAMRLVREEHASLCQAVMQLAALPLVHLHMVRIAPDGTSPRLLGRDPGLPAWRSWLVALQSEAAGAVKDLGLLGQRSDLAVLAGLMSHADVVLGTEPYVLDMAQGLGKMAGDAGMDTADGGNVWPAHDTGAYSGVARSEAKESCFFSMICDRFPFIVAPR